MLTSEDVFEDVFYWTRLCHIRHIYISHSDDPIKYIYYYYLV